MYWKVGGVWIGRDLVYAASGDNAVASRSSDFYSEIAVTRHEVKDG
jgi:hypothetical protein